MLVAEARVETEASRRYLGQLCRHLSHEAKSHPEVQMRVEWSDDRGVVDLGPGRCALRADPGVLRLHVEAPDEESLHQVEGLIAHHLDRFGTNGQPQVTWDHPRVTTTGSINSRQPGQGTTHLADADPYPTGADDTDAAPGGGSTTARSWPTVVAIVVVVGVLVLLIVLHLVLGGGFRGAH